MPRLYQHSPGRHRSPDYGNRHGLQRDMSPGMIGMPKNSRERLTFAPGEFAPVTPPARGTKVLNQNSRTLRSPSSLRIGLAVVVMLVSLFFGSRFYHAYGGGRRGGSSSLQQYAELHRLLQQLDSDVSAMSKRIDNVYKEGSSSHQSMTQLMAEVHLLHDKFQQFASVQESAIAQIADDTKEKLKKVETVVRSVANDFHNLEDRMDKELKTVSQRSAGTVTVWRKEGNDDGAKQDILEQLYRRVYLDGTGKIDWARASMGGHILHSSAGIGHDWWSWMLQQVGHRLPRYHYRKPPSTKPVDVVIGGPDSIAAGCSTSDKIQSGHCFAIPGSEGNLTIGLPTVVDVFEVHIDHVAPELAPTTETAPKIFDVYVDDCDNLSCWDTGYLGSSTPGMHVGRYEFQYPSVFSQSFSLPVGTGRTPGYPTRSFSKNHGGSYTCIYRLRVHGSKSERT